MDDGIVFRADFYRPPQEGRYSVILLLLPSITGPNHLLEEAGQPLKKILPVFVSLENPFPFDPSDHDMMQGTGGVNAGLPSSGGLGGACVSNTGFVITDQQRSNVSYDLPWILDQKISPANSAFTKSATGNTVTLSKSYLREPQ
jgi:hypothetical protein